jgi:RNA polymerase sigma factor (TIGR02999 family)
MNVDVTQLLADWQGGDREALDRLMPLVYPELHAIAERCFRGAGGRPVTLQPTALVHEAWLKLARTNAPIVESRSHFLALAARVMRHLLVDHARRRANIESEAAAEPTLVATGDVAAALDLVDLDGALADLARRDERQAKVVELRFFGVLEHEAIATALGVSVATVERDWAAARAWLGVRLRGSRPS